MNYSVVPHNTDGPNALKAIKNKIIHAIENDANIKAKRAHIKSLRDEVKKLLGLSTAERTMDIIYSSIADLEIELEIDVQTIADMVNREAGDE